MAKFRNKKLRIKGTELICLILFFIISCASVFFFGEMNETKKVFNISKTNVDYVVQAPSSDQISEIRGMEGVNNVVPYYYRSVSYSGGKKNCNTNLFIIENADDIDYTTFSNQLLQSGKAPSGEMQICITDEFAKNTGLGVGDELTLSIDGTVMQFDISGIYASDYRFVGGSLLTVYNETIASSMKSTKYSGAYVSSDTSALLDDYFKNEYIPMGDMRTKEEFESEEAYKTYLETRGQSDSSMKTFVTADYMNEVTNRNQAKIWRSMGLMIVMFVAAYLLIMVFIIKQGNGYTNTNVIKDVRDNFTLEQEDQMYSNYYGMFGLLMVVANALSYVLSVLLGWAPVISYLGIASLLVTIILVLITSYGQRRKMKERFFLENKKWEEEKRKAELKKRERNNG